MPALLRIDREQVRGLLPDLLDSITDAVAVVDAERRVVAANRRYVEVFGTDRNEIAGASCQDSLRCPEREAGIEGRCSACVVMETRSPAHRILAIPGPDGAPKRWEATFNPVLDAAGDLTHVVEVWRDISDRTKLEAQLSHSERLASLGSLAAGVAHEINNPLASVLATVESLQRWLQRTQGIDPGAMAEARGSLDAAEREIERCRETTDKLMLLAQPASADPAWVDLNRAIADTFALLQHQMRKQGVTSALVLEEDPPMIWARESGIRSICMNLVMNAVQAMPEGGHLELSTGVHGEGVRLEVADSGPGIDPRILARIWDPFFTTKPPGKGTGLGLSITRGLVERYGGTIAAEPREGGGVRFIVDLPRVGPGGHGG